MTQYRWIVISLAFVLLGLLVWYVGELFIYLLISAVIALIGRPIIKLLDRVQVHQWQLPDSIKAVIAMLLIFGVLSAIFSFFIPRLIEQTQQLEKLDTAAIAEGLEEPLAALRQVIDQYGILKLKPDQSLEELFKERVIEIASSLNLSNIFGAIAGITGDLFIGLFSILFITFFFLKERNLLRSVFTTLTPDPYIDKTRNVLDSIKLLLTRYFIGLLLELILVGSLCAFGFSLLGVKNAIVIGFFAGLFNVIPYLGPLIGGGMSVSLATLGALEMDFYTGILPMIAKVLVVFLVVQLIDNFVFQPLIYSSSVKAHPLEIFLVILAAGSLFGIGGMVLAIPAYTVLRVVAKEFFDQFKVVRSITRSI
jgi:predicted PurR-regulated permease PerM